MIWKRDQETRMELFSGDPWLQLNEFTRSIVVRHIWRALEKLAKGSVVVIDSPPQEWSAQIDKTFDDRGIDPWGEGVAARRPPVRQRPLAQSSSAVRCEEFVEADEALGEALFVVVARDRFEFAARGDDAVRHRIARQRRRARPRRAVRSRRTVPAFASRSLSMAALWRATNAS